MTGQLSIKHHPYGLDNPYLVQPDERIPRDPIGGDMVSVSFVTEPGHQAETVRVFWIRNGRPQTPIGARPVSRSTDADRWLVELGVMEGGDTVAYWIEAEGGGTTARSATEQFTTRRWRRLAQAAAIEQSLDGVRVATVAEDGAPGPIITLTQAAAGSVIRVELAGAISQDHAVPLASETSAVAVNGDDGSLVIDPSTGHVVLRSATRPEVLTPLTLRWLEAEDGIIVAVELLGLLKSDEALVGFGERFDALDQRGRAPDVVVYEQYKNQGNRTYLPVPFFISSAGYGCLIEGTCAVTYDLGRTAHDRWRCMAAAPEQRSTGIAFDLFVGVPASILRAFTTRTGRPEMPPTWAFGPWMSSNEWNTQARVLAEVAATIEHGIPATALVIEAWSDETTFYIWNGAQYQPQPGTARPRLKDFSFPSDSPWPDPKGMIDALHAAGIRVLLWQIPALKQNDVPHAQHDTDVTHAIKHQYVLHDAEGQPYRNPAFWFNGAHIPDFTHPAATDWWLSKRAYLLEDLGVDGFKTDGGEHLQGRGLQAYDGRRGDELVNAYPNLYIAAYHRLARDLRGGDALTFSRAGHTGAGAFPAHWAGDENSTWEAYRRSLVAGLSAGLSGIPFWGWDIAGFSESLPSAELYLRATAMATFCPIMQYHSEYNPSGPSRDRTPWNIQRHTGDTHVIPLSRFFARLRMNLLPYIVNEAAHAVATGEPLLRPLLLDHPHDAQIWRMEDQYSFGRDLLVAPVVDEGATERQVYLPAGLWYDFWTGEAVDGGQRITVAIPLDRIPVYVRAGTIIPLQLGAAGELGDDVGNSTTTEQPVTFRIFPGDTQHWTWTDNTERAQIFQVMQTDDRGMNVTVPARLVACVLVLPDGRHLQVEPSRATQDVVFH